MTLSSSMTTTTRSPRTYAKYTSSLWNLALCATTKRKIPHLSVANSFNKPCVVHEFSALVLGNRHALSCVICVLLRCSNIPLKKGPSIHCARCRGALGRTSPGWSVTVWATLKQHCCGNRRFDWGNAVYNGIMFKKNKSQREKHQHSTNNVFPPSLQLVAWHDWHVSLDFGNLQGRNASPKLKVHNQDADPGR